jgi:hypothetical protein
MLRGMDAVFPGSNDLGIPDLDLEQQADCVPLPVWAWGSVARTRDHDGTWHFFVEDKRFSHVLIEPDAVVATGCVAACEPNISVFDDTPPAVAFHSLYRKRWVARYWQSCGVRVFVDCNLPAWMLARRETLYGIPEGWRAWSTRGYERRMESLDEEYQWACNASRTTDVVFLVVGGGRGVAQWCQSHRGAVHSGYSSTRSPYGEQIR